MARMFGGKWEVVRKIGAGGMGTVYEVRHKDLNIRRALKHLKGEYQDNSAVTRRFKKEAVTMAFLDHPHIVKVHDVDIVEMFILMDLVQGPNLAQLIQRPEGLTYGQVLQIGREIASALTFAHKHNFIHRDLKPGNILIDEASGRAVLSDFGIAKQLRGDGDPTVDPTTSFVGTYRYSSPEQMRNENVDYRADLYSLGIVLYEACTGRRYLAEIATDAIPAHVMGYIPGWEPQLQFPASVPEDFCRIVTSCVMLDPAQRIDSAQSLLDLLGQCVAVTENVPSIDASVLLTEVTQVTVAESFAAFRADRRERIENALAAIERSRPISGSLDVEPPDLAEVRQGLSEVGALEEVGSFEAAFTKLDDLAVNIDALAAFHSSSLQAALGRLRRSLEEESADLRARAGEALFSEVDVDTDAWFDELDARLLEEQLESSFDLIQQIQKALGTCRGRAAELVERHIVTASEEFGRLRDELSALHAALDRGDQDEDLLDDSDDIEGRARLSLEGGLWAEAVLELENGRNELTARVERLRSRLSAYLESRLNELAARRDGIESSAISAIDRGVGAEMDAAVNETNEALARGDPLAASRHFGVLIDLVMQTEKAVAEEWRIRCEQKRAELEAAVQQANSLPDDLVGAALASADAVLREVSEDREGVEQLESANEALVAAVAAKDSFETARNARARAMELAENLKAAPDPIINEILGERLEAAVSNGAAAYANGDWDAAGQQFAIAENLWRQAVRDKHQREAEERAALLDRERRSQLDGLRLYVRRLDELSALEKQIVRLDDDSGGHEAPLRAAAEAIERKISDSSLEESRASIEKIGSQIDDALESAELRLTERVAAECEALEKATEQLFQVFGRFVEPAGRQGLEDAQSSARSALSDHDWEAAIEALRTGHQLVAELRKSCSTAARDQVDRLLKEASAIVGELGRLGATPDRDLVEIRARVARSLEEDQSSESHRIAEDARDALREQCDRAIDDAIRESRERNDHLLAALANLPVEDHERAAIDAARSAAAAESGLEGIDALERVRTEMDDLRARAEQRATSLSVARDELEGVVAAAAMAPQELVANAVSDATEILIRIHQNAAPSYPRDGVETLKNQLIEARRQIEALLDQVGLFNEASAARDCLRGAIEHARQAGVGTWRLRAARAFGRRADAAFSVQAWPQAAEQYELGLQAAQAIDVGKIGARPLPWVFVSFGLMTGVALYLWPPLTSVENESEVEINPTTEKSVGSDVTALGTVELLADGATLADGETPADGETDEPSQAHPFLSFVPPEEVVRIAEGGERSFGVTVNPEAGEQVASIRWHLDGEIIADANGNSEWVYRPDFEAASDSPHEVSVKLGESERTWNVIVEDVDRPAQVAFFPPPGRLEREDGERIELKAEASDPDGPVRYKWKRRGRTIEAAGPTLVVDVSGEEEIAVEVADDKGRPIKSGKWRIALARPPSLDLSSSPAVTSLSLDWNESKRFSLDGAKEDLSKLQFSWTLDGERLSSTRTYTLTNKDSAQIKKSGVELAVKVSDDRGRTFSRSWKIGLRPPAPRIVGAAPQANVVAAALDQPVELRLSAADPVGDQELEYRFQGENGPSQAGPVYRVDPRSDELTVVASIVDNYGQASEEHRWIIKPLDVEAQVRRWLEELLAAENAKNASQVARLRGQPSVASDIQKAMNTKGDLTVVFEGIEIAPSGDRATISYRRVENFRDPTGKPRSMEVAVRDKVRIEEGKIVLER